MATAGLRSAIAGGARSMAARSRISPSTTTSSLKRITSSFLPSPPLSSASRLASMLGSVGSQKPLHSAIASARLTSSLAMDTTSWSSLSLDLAVPR